MVLKFYNTLTRKKEAFKPIKKGEVRMYVCGPTVYGPIHIGNARTFIAFDVLYRYLKYKGFKVKYVQNITDVGHLTDVGDDKIMMGAKKRGMNVFDFVELMMKDYFKDLESLNILKPDMFPRASKHVQDMIRDVQKLIEKGYAYVANGTVYFDVGKFKDYGKLSGQKPEELKLLRRKEDKTKRNVGDFALWIPCSEDYPMKWKSPWGTGFPGWHIECSTMSSRYLGLPFDIHCGGKDLIFPHHEDEIAQAEGATGRRFVNYWLHSQFILINGEKMSKSLRNIISARDAVKKYGRRAVRYFLMSSHYRTEINFTEAAIKQAEETVKGIEDFISRLKSVKKGKYDNRLGKLTKKLGSEFEDSMDDDMNISLALAKIFDFIRAVNKTPGIGERNAKEIVKTFMDFDRVFGLNLGEEEGWKSLKEAGKEVKDLIEKRESFRKERNWKEADRIREQLKKKSIVLEDTEAGPKWKIVR